MINILLFIILLLLRNVRDESREIDIFKISKGPTNAANELIKRPRISLLDSLLVESVIDDNDVGSYSYSTDK